MARVLTFISLFFFVSLPFFVPVSQPLAPAITKKIFIGVDGLSREAFDHARAQGLFAPLNHAATHVAPFPSISDYSWNVLVGSRLVHGKRARIKSYEASYFDRDKNLLVNDAREYFRRLGEDHLYFNGAFEHYLNPFVEALLYIPTEELPGLELKQLKASIIADPKDLVTVMVASSDALAHTRSDASKFLGQLDQFINELVAHYQQEGKPVEIILVSDHGQASRFLPNQKPKPLIGVDLSSVLKRAGLESVNKLEKSSDMVIPMMALANYASVFFYDDSKQEIFAQEIRKENWFSLGIARQSFFSNRVELKVFDKSGEALLEIKHTAGVFSYLYRPMTSNPLLLPEASHGRWLSDLEARQISADGQFPDSLHRIAFSAFEIEADFPDMIITLEDDYFLAGELNSFTTMFQTHGSMSARSSLGLVASTKSFAGQDTVLRSEEILSSFNIAPHDLFQLKPVGYHSVPTIGQKLINHPNYAGIQTGSDQFGNQKVFKILERVLDHSQYVFDSQSIKTVLGVMRPLLNQQTQGMNSGGGLNFQQQNFSQGLGLSDVAGLVDAVIKSGNIEAIQKDEKFLKIKAKLAASSKSGSDRRPTSEHHHDFNLHELSQKHHGKADASKKLVMKAYSSMFLLEKALELPEFALINDPRDLQFFSDWNKQKSPAQLPKLFSEIFTERKVSDEIFPQKMPYLYNPDLSPVDNTTIVYIPGIYNSLFDNEIFQMGLKHLVNKLGLRVIAPPVLSSCSSSYNGEILMDFLKQDLKSQARLGRQAQKYFLWGYSKGGVDALHGFTKDETFVKNHIQGLLTIASPLKGTSILNKSDLPMEVLSLLGSEIIPEICRTTEKASSSVTPQAAQLFFKKNSSRLVGLTKYYSMSFAQSISESHLFMRATKTIGRFNEENDGVVTLSASRFPDEFGAIDLGVVKTDHLAGIVASRFPQVAFMESLVMTLLEAQAFKNHAHESLAIKYLAKSTTPDQHRSLIKNLILSEMQELFSGKKTNSELWKISQSIQTKLSLTPYAVSDFSFLSARQGMLLSYPPVTRHLGRSLAFVAENDRSLVLSQEEVLDLLLSRLQTSGRNLIKSNRIIVPVSERVAFELPLNELGYQEDLRLILRELDGFIRGKKVHPITLQSHQQGIAIVYDHASSVDFRNEYQLSFESTSPVDADDNTNSGWETYLSPEKEVMARLSSQRSSIRLSTYSMRFLARDFPKLKLDLTINDDVEGADALFGGSGKDDSAFQLWFTFRVISKQTDRLFFDPAEKVMTIGYYFGDEIAGKNLKLGAIYKNYYSEKDFVIATLPPAKQKLIGLGKSMLGQRLLSSHNLLADIKKAYPDIDADMAEIIGITIQHDSNDTKNTSEALFKSLLLSPSP